MAQWFETLNSLHSACWRRMTLDSVQLKPTIQTVLATIGTDGAPQARMVVLRGADRQAGIVNVHTDATSVKITELRGDARASIHLWNDAEQLQIRLRGEMSIASGDNAAQHWARVPDGSRSNYGVVPAPGSRIRTSDAYSRVPDPAKFAVLTMQVAEMDVVHLSDDYHRRASYSRADGWRGQWLAP